MRRGANSVEFALLMPPFVLLTAAIVDYSWMIFELQELKSAVRVGCRGAATIDPGQHELQLDAVLTAARERVSGAYGGSCQVSAEAIGSLPNRSLECTVAIGPSSLTGLVPMPSTLQASTVVRLEYQRRQQ